MRFRRRSFRAPFKRFREPLVWHRRGPTTGASVAASNAVVALTSAAPTGSVSPFGGSIILTNLDQRVTLRRLKLQLSQGATTIVDNDLEVIIGVLMAGQNEAFRTPLLTLNSDVQADWLDLWRLPVQTTPLPNFMFWGGPYNRNIRTMRKVDEDQNISLAFVLSRGGGGAVSAAQAVSLTLYSSALFSRTSR